MTELPPELLASLHRFACLLRGDTAAGLRDFTLVLAETRRELEQYRNEKAAAAFLIRKLRAQAQPAPDVAEEPPGDDTALFLRRFSALAEPGRCALALFYLDLFPTDQIATIMGVEVEELGAQLATARGSLRGKPLDFPNPLQSCHRPWSETKVSRVAKAVKLAKDDDALKARLEEQEIFDNEQRRLIDGIAPPDLHATDAGAPPAHPATKKVVCDPVVLSGLCGVLLILGLVVFFVMQGMKHFPGHEAVYDMVDTAQSMSGMEVDPVEMEIGKLGDWLFMKAALENYLPAQDLGAVKAAGCRVFKQNGHSVAQIIVTKPEAVLYVFKAADFGVNLKPEDQWRFFERDEWAGAISAHGDCCTVVTVRGAEKDVREVVAKLAARSGS